MTKKSFHSVVVVIVIALIPAVALADPLDDLAKAIERFRGVGDAQVTHYRVPLHLPDEPEEDMIVLVEEWTTPSELTLAAREAFVPRAVVRSWALFLEPVYVARASLMGLNLSAGLERIRENAEHRHEKTSDGSRIVVIFGDRVDDKLPLVLQDLATLDAVLDASGRIVSLTVDLRGAAGREGERIAMDCVYEGADDALPHHVEWKLPNGEPVRVATDFRIENGRRVPAERFITFPSRWDPGETESIRIRYGPYDFDPSATAPAGAPAPFRFDGNGLIPD